MWLVHLKPIRHGTGPVRDVVSRNGVPAVAVFALLPQSWPDRRRSPSQTLWRAVGAGAAAIIRQWFPPVLCDRTNAFHQFSDRSGGILGHRINSGRAGNTNKGVAIMFGKMFGSKKTQEKPAETLPKEFAPSTRISYDPQLIENFKEDHAALFNLYGTITSQAESGEYQALSQTLKSFQSALQGHLLEENLRLYTYLSKCLREDSESSELMQDMKSEMGQIGRGVMRFIKHYNEFGVDDGNVDKFRRELTEIGAALKDRTQREESSLYTLYLPPQNYETL